MDELQIAATRSDHYSSIARSVASIASRMAALQHSFANQAPSSLGDQAWLDMLIASSTGLISSAAALKEVVFVPPDQPVP